jgi:hypothetical protein
VGTSVSCPVTSQACINSELVTHTLLLVACLHPPKKSGHQEISLASLNLALSLDQVPALPQSFLLSPSLLFIWLLFQEQHWLKCAGDSDPYPDGKGQWSSTSAPTGTLLCGQESHSGLGASSRSHILILMFTFSLGS